MMAYSEDHIALAAEYALGTLDADERAQVESMMSVDSNFSAIVEAWERKLGVLNQMVGLVEPRPEVWNRIKVAAGLSGPQEALILPQAARPVAPAPMVADDIAVDRSAAERSNVIALSRQARRWRGVATAMTALAAVLVAMVAVQAYRPEMLPEGLRAKSPQQVARLQEPSGPATPGAGSVAPAQYVALLQTDGTAPAFILTVDAGTKSFTVRKVGAAQQPGKSYELWIVSDKLQRPRSLGVIGGNDFTTRPALASYDPDMVNKATYAVTVEPEGGSPTGVATGPIVYTGKLVETVPASR